MRTQESAQLTSIAVDDEPMALKIIRNHAQHTPWIHLTETFRSAHLALEYLKHHDTDIIFLDINMPDLSGLEMAAMLDSYTRVIFTTAHSEFAIQGFEIAAVDYLLKPISLDRFQTACDRARTIIATDRSTKVQLPDHLFIKDGHNWIRINMDELVYVKASDNYVIFQELHNRSVVRITLTEALSKIAGRGFERCHKSYGIALKKIDKIESTYVVAGEFKIPLSTAYKSGLLEKLNG
jgi:DNA-binding LytR/AlgR family response regulator